MLCTNVSAPWHCKWFLQSEYADVHYMRKLVQDVKGHHTSQLSLACQLCQVEVLAVTDKAIASGLYKQLVKADIFE